MAGTLIRHEYHRTARPFGALVGLATLGVLLAFLLSWTAWPVVAGLGSALGMIITAAFLLVLVLGLAVDLYKSGFSRQGYLTHLLPVKGSTILWAKIGWAFLLMLVGMVWFAGALIVSIMAAQLSTGAPISQVWASVGGAVRDVVDATPTWVLVTGLLLVVAMALAYVIQVYFAVSVGSEKRFHRLEAGGPVLIYALVYVVMQLVMMIGIVLIPVGLSLVGEVRLVTLDLGVIFSENSNEVMPLGFVPALLLLGVAMLWRTVVSWRSRVALR